ncbi:unnamed protein product [marine sediment metagenome]|uniref:Uncharacterized protein n=1 Tax=marine sediment metagenome TaxID=412755 RepID=X1RXG7_9ZZZZ
MVRKGLQQDQRLFDVGLGGGVKIDYEPGEGDKPSVPVYLTEEELAFFEKDDTLAEQVVTERDCAEDMICWQYLKRKEFDTKEAAEQLELIQDEVDLELGNTILKPITREVAKPFIEKYEWLGQLGTFKFGYGLFFPYKSGIGHKLGVAICFSKTTTWQAEVSICGEEYRDKVILLCRGAAANWAVKNANSYAIAQTLKAVERDTDYRIILAYSDRRAGEVGTIYQALNWLFIGWGAEGTDHVPAGLVDPTDMRFHTRGLPKELKSKSSLLKAGYEVLDVKRANKGRYITFLGSRKERKELMEVLRFKILPYPKREDFTDPRKLKRFRAVHRKGM